MDGSSSSGFSVLAVRLGKGGFLGNGPNAVSESTVSDTELRELFFLVLTKFRGENSVSSSQPFIACQSEPLSFS